MPAFSAELVVDCGGTTASRNSDGMSSSGPSSCLTPTASTADSLEEWEACDVSYEHTFRLSTRLAASPPKGKRPFSARSEQRRRQPQELLNFSLADLEADDDDASNGATGDTAARPALLQGMRFKTVHADGRLLKTLMYRQGLEQCSSENPNFNVLWTNAVVKTQVLAGLYPWQRVNHFPRTKQLTRKDWLLENLQRAVEKHGEPYRVVPDSLVLPAERARLEKLCGPGGRLPFRCIVKPVSQCQGRGIFITTQLADIPVEQRLVVSRYVDRPRLVDGHKFDVRLYVAVTSWQPLICYLHTHGLTRFASEKYDYEQENDAHFANHFVHLTNYSLNKNNDGFVKNETMAAEDIGHKWTFGAVLRRLKEEGVDTNLLMMRIEDLIVKALLSVRQEVGEACRTQVAHVNTCFELFGFDILIDDELRPWLLEVNFKPSLACDAPLDTAVKSRLIVDLLNMASIPAHPPANGDPTADNGDNMDTERSRPNSAPLFAARLQHKARMERRIRTDRALDLLQPENSAARRLELYKRKLSREAARCGEFVRLYPRAHTLRLYGSICNDSSDAMDTRLHNAVYGVFNGSAGGANAQQKDSDRQRLMERAHRQLLAARTFPKWSNLSADVRTLLTPQTTDLPRYHKEMYGEGGMSSRIDQLPRIPLERRRRTPSYCDQARRERDERLRKAEEAKKATSL